MLEMLSDLFMTLMTDFRWFRRILIGALVVLCLWLGAELGWYALLGAMLAIFEAGDYLFDRRRDRHG